MKTKPIFWIAFLMFNILLSGMACSLTGDVREAVENIASTAAPLATQNSPFETAAADDDTHAGESGSAFDQLQSYRNFLTIKLEGQSQDGSPFSQQLEILNEKVSTQDAFHARVSNSETDEQSLEIFSIGNQTFIYNPADTSPCLMFTTGEDSAFEMGLTRPEEFFNQVEKGELLQSGEQVNGIETDRYRVNQFHLGIGVLSSQTSEVWYAAEGGYIVRFKGEAKGNAGIGKTRGDGTITWEYNLTDINQIKEIALPADCVEKQQANQDIPIPSNANEKDIYGGVIAFSSPDNPANVAEYYRNELPAFGWEIIEESNDDPLFILKIKKEDRKIQIMISPGNDENSTAVIITEDE